MKYFIALGNMFPLSMTNPWNTAQHKKYLNIFCLTQGYRLMPLTNKRHIVWSKTQRRGQPSVWVPNPNGADRLRIDKTQGRSKQNTHKGKGTRRILCVCVCVMTASNRYTTAAAARGAGGAEGGGKKQSNQMELYKLSGLWSISKVLPSLRLIRLKYWAKERECCILSLSLSLYIYVYI